MLDSQVLTLVKVEGQFLDWFLGLESSTYTQENAICRNSYHVRNMLISGGEIQKEQQQNRLKLQIEMLHEHSGNDKKDGYMSNSFHWTSSLVTVYRVSITNLWALVSEDWGKIKQYAYI